MKTAITLLLFLASLLSSPAQSIAGAGFVMGKAPDYAKEAQEAQQRRIDSINNFVPFDRWRILTGTTNYASGRGWVQFQGAVVQVVKDGIIMVGSYGVPGDPTPDFQSQRFLIKNFPYPVAENDRLNFNRNLTAFTAGVYTYMAVTYGSTTVHAFDYGKPWTPPPLTPEQIAALKKKNEAARKAGADKALAFNQAQADKGDAYGQLRMGERYRDGEGVEKDLAKARDYFTKAAAQGNAEAAGNLKALPAN